MTVATLATATSAENRKAVIAGTIGNVLEWYDFGVYGYLATTMSQLFFPGDDKTISLLKAFAVFGVGCARPRRASARESPRPCRAPWDRSPRRLRTAGQACVARVRCRWR